MTTQKYSMKAGDDLPEIPPPIPKHLFYVDGICSSGKTHAAAKTIIDIVSSDPRQNILYVAPNITVLKEVEKLLKKAESDINPAYDFSIIRINTGNQLKETVQQSVIPHLKNPSEHTKAIDEIYYSYFRVVLITHNTFLNLSSKKFDRGRILIIDELFQNFIIGNKVSIDSTNIFDLIFNVGDQNNISFKNKAQGKAIAENKSQDPAFQSDSIINLASVVHKGVYKIEFERLDSGFQYAAFINPEILEGYNKVIYLAALFKDSFQYHLWKKQGYAFSLEETISNRLLKTKHSNGNLVNIYYLLEQSEWRTNKVAPIIKNCISEIESLYNKGEMPFTNEAIPSQNIIYRFQNPNAAITEMQLMEGNAFGQNSYQKYHHVIWLQTKMPNPYLSSWLSKNNFSEKEKRKYYYHVDAYQACSRISIRNENDKNIKSMVVGDLDTAKYLKSMFEGSTIEHLKLNCLKDIDKPSQKPGRKSNTLQISTSDKASLSKMRKRLESKHNISIPENLKAELFHEVISELNEEKYNPSQSNINHRNLYKEKLLSLLNL